MRPAHDPLARQSVPGRQQHGEWPPSLLAISMVLILAATLHPVLGAKRHPISLGLIPHHPFWAAANVVLFWPLGVALALRRWPLAKTTAAGCALSLLIEAAQYWIPGRFSNLDDVVTNGLGALTGALLVRAAFSEQAQCVVPGVAELLRRVRA